MEYTDKKPGINLAPLLYVVVMVIVFVLGTSL